MDESTINAMCIDIIRGKQEEINQLKAEKEELAKQLEEEKQKNRHFDQALLMNCTNCPVCFFPFNQHYRLPVVGSCGHTVCNRCSDSLQEFTLSCPMCRAANSFRLPAKNFLARDLLEQGNLFPKVDKDNTLMAVMYEDVALLSKDRTRWIKFGLKPPQNSRVGDLGSVYLNGEIYFFGSPEKLHSNSKCFYKLDKNLQWIRLADMNIERCYITKSCLAWNGCIWVFGGYGSEHLKSVERYDPKEDKWTMMPDLKHSRIGAALLWNDRIIFTGNNNTDKNIGNIVESYYPEDGSRIELPNLPYEFFKHLLLSRNEKIIIIGERIQENTSYDIWELDPEETNPKWRSLSSTKDYDDTGYMVGGAIHDNEVYVIRGDDQDGDGAQVLIFDGMEWRDGPNILQCAHTASTMTIPQDFADRLCNYYNHC